VEERERERLKGIRRMKEQNHDGMYGRAGMVNRRDKKEKIKKERMGSTAVVYI